MKEDRQVSEILGGTSRYAQTQPPSLLYLLSYPRPFLDEHVEQQCLACIAARRVIGLRAIVSQVGLGISESTGKKRRGSRK
jgi:hypothetical protein